MSLSSEAFWRPWASSRTTDRHLKDRELIGALANMARSQQTLIASGLVYEESAAESRAAGADQHAATGAWTNIAKWRQQHLGHARLKDADSLHALVFTLRLAHVHTSGRPLSRGFIDFLHERFPEAAATLDSAGEPGSRIIIP